MEEASGSVSDGHMGLYRPTLHQEDLEDGEGRVDLPFLKWKAMKHQQGFTND